jgi:hypothetical protein
MRSTPESVRDRRRLEDLVSVGPATVGDLHLLGISTVVALAREEAPALYRRLCEVTGVRHDPCCEDVFAAAIAQARDPDLPAALKKWWTWSRLRKARNRAAQWPRTGCAASYTRRRGQEA